MRTRSANNFKIIADAKHKPHSDVVGISWYFSLSLSLSISLSLFPKSPRLGAQQSTACDTFDAMYVIRIINPRQRIEKNWP